MNQAMNQTDLNAELFAAESRGRKHIPLAVFAVIMIHVILFLVLLIAAGCRAKARARLNLEPAAETAVQAAPAQAESALRPDALAAVEPRNRISEPDESVIASEPIVEPERVSASGMRRTARRASPSGSRPEAETVVRTYVVQPGDTLGKIAKEHGATVRAIRTENQLKGDLIFPGQKLRVSTRQEREGASALTEV